MNQPRMEPADPVARRVGIVLVAIGAALGGGVVYAFTAGSDAVSAWLVARLGAEATRGRTLMGIAAALTTPLVLLAAWLHWRGGRVLAARRFPPPGSRVMRDTPILEGRDALARGQLLRVIAAMLAGGALLIGVMLWRLAALLG
jgi:hypothetical protein